MAKLILWCLLLLPVALAEKEGGNGSTVGDLSNLVNLKDDDLVRETSTQVKENGEEVKETSLTDKNCHVQVSIATSINSNSTVVEDLDGDTELARLSSAPKVCYVLPHANVTGKCRNGYIISKSSANENLNTTTDTTNYKEGRNLTLDDLPANLRPLCENLAIRELVRVEASDNDDDDVSTTTTAAGSGGVRRKRSLFRRCCQTGYRYCLIRVRYCRYVLLGCTSTTCWWGTRCVYYYRWSVCSTYCARYSSVWGSC